MENSKLEPPDHHVYSLVMFYRHTVEFFVSAVRFYEELLKNEASLVEKDEHLKNFLTQDIRREFGLGRALDEATRIRQWLEQPLIDNPDRFDVDLNVSHKSVRYIKSVGLLYLGFLKQRRNILSAQPNVTENLISAIDRQITVQEEAFNNQGVFKNTSLIPLLADQTYSPSNDSIAPNEITSFAKATRPRPQVIKTIEILDAELRERCLDLFNQFEETGQPERHDTVVAEATRILENRLRLLTKSTDGAAALKLVTRAFDSESPMLKISEVKGEQEGAELLFRGVFGFIRNQYQHKLLSDVTPERVLQILGLTDFLISIINSASQNKESHTSGDS